MRGPLVIVAGPGTGKTKTLTERVKSLLDSSVPASRILALTFTKKAAEEMSQRIGNPRVHTSTFHALCFALILQKTGETPQFIAESDRMQLLKKTPRPAVLKGLSAREVSLLVSRVKNLAEDSPDAVRITRAYDEGLSALGMVDFDDILLKTRDMLAADSAWRASIADRYEHIMVDEFQDTNTLQYEILQLLCGTENICVIGDPLQSIYGFRGADGDMFARFLRDFPQAQQVTLTTNYRSARSVVMLANAVYADAPQLQAYSDAAGRVRAVEVLNEYSEAAWVLAAIEQAIGGSNLQKAVSNDARNDHKSLRDFAVVYRGRAAARALQKAFEQSGIPYQIVGDGSPYEEPEVQLLVQLLARMVDTARPFSVKNMTANQADALIEKLDSTLPPADIAEKIIKTCGTVITPALRQFCGSLVRFKAVAQAVAHIDDIAAQDFYDPRAEAVTLLTIHASKGLEFDHVFLIAAEDGVLPSKKGDEHEERRLFYVAVTRAKSSLDVLHARFRSGEKAVRSRFVRELPQAVLPSQIDDALAGDERRAAKRQAKRAQASLF